jgi:hypothetical protein
MVSSIADKIIPRIKARLNTGLQNEILPLKPVWFSGWVFPLFAALLLLITGMLLLIPRPELVVAKGMLVHASPSGKEIQLTADLPENNRYRIHSGQAVEIRFQDYPGYRYGTVHGVLQQVLLTDSGKSFKANAVLPKGWYTSKNKKIAYKVPLKFDVVVIITNRSLLENIFSGPIKYLNL